MIAQLPLVGQLGRLGWRHAHFALQEQVQVQLQRPHFGLDFGAQFQPKTMVVLAALDRGMQRQVERVLALREHDVVLPFDGGELFAAGTQAKPRYAHFRVPARIDVVGEADFGHVARRLAARLGVPVLEVDDAFAVVGIRRHDVIAGCRNGAVCQHRQG